MGNFSGDIQGNALGGIGVRNQFKNALRELEVRASEGKDGSFTTEFTPGSYAPIKARLYFPEDSGIVGLEGEVFPFEGEANDELRIALNYLNVEVDTYRFYIQNGGVYVRCDLLPNQDRAPLYHPRELRQALTGLCAQKAVFGDALERVQGGSSWRYVKDALKAFR